MAAKQRRPMVESTFLERRFAPLTGAHAVGVHLPLGIGAVMLGPSVSAAGRLTTTVVIALGRSGAAGWEPERERQREAALQDPTRNRRRDPLHREVHRNDDWRNGGHLRQLAPDRRDCARAGDRHGPVDPGTAAGSGRGAVPPGDGCRPPPSCAGRSALRSKPCHPGHCAAGQRKDPAAAFLDRRGQSRGGRRLGVGAARKSAMPSSSGSRSSRRWVPPLPGRRGCAA